MARIKWLARNFSYASSTLRNIRREIMVAIDNDEDVVVNLYADMIYEVRVVL
jgi:hypothetical protein